jgi:hypothetical protein
LFRSPPLKGEKIIVMGLHKKIHRWALTLVHFSFSS